MTGPEAQAGMIWATNTHRDHLEDFYREVPGGRAYIHSAPKETIWHTSAELAAQGLVGLYRRPTTPDEAQAAGEREYARVTGGPPEPSITINGHTLTLGQAMTVRVAVESFAGELHANGLGEDATGKSICAGYLARIDEIRRLICLR